MYIEDQGHSAYLAQTCFTYILGHILTYRPLENISIYFARNTTIEYINSL